MWSEVSPQEFGFRRLVQWRSKISGVGRQELFKEAVFALIDDPSAVGRLYEAIPALAESLQQVADSLSQEFTVETPQTDSGLQELFGGGGKDEAAPETGLLTILKEPGTRGRAREVIANVLEAQRQLKKDSKAAGYLLDTCAKANAALLSAVKDGLRAESKRNGVAAQLDGIEANVARIRAFLAQYAQG